ncbi:MAG: DUF4112 domain-containing protein [Myxococcota bacterium]
MSNIHADNVGSSGASTPIGASEHAARAAPASDEGTDSARLSRIRALANILDTKYGVPGTPIRFGFDAILGVVPVVGDTATLLIGLYPVLEALRSRARKRTVAKMLGNLGIDWLLGLVPFLDLVLDVAFKANTRNLRLLERDLKRGR